MHSVVSRLALSLSATALLAGALVAVGGGSALADAPRQPPQADAVNPGGYTALGPTRLVDTRVAPKRTLAPMGALALTVANAGVPSNAAAVVVNLTVAGPKADGYLSAYPGPAKPNPLVSTLNFKAGQVVANAAVVKVNGGQITIFNGSTGASDVVVDVTGWFASGTAATDGAFTPVGPARLLDTRTAPSVPVPAGGTRTLAVRGQKGVPSSAGATVLNVTVVNPAAGGYLTLYPGGDAPKASNVNFVTGQTVAGLAAVQLDGDGDVVIRNASTKPVQITVDVAGSFQGTTARTTAMFSFLAPARVLDTRFGNGSPKTPLAGGQTRTVPVVGRGGVPTVGVAAVVLTVTVTNTKAGGYLTVFPGGTPPTASTLNFGKGQTVPNLVVVPVSSNGTVSLYNGSPGTVDVLADVAGFVRSTDLVPPAAGVSHYIRNSVTPTMSPGQVAIATSAIGAADGQAASKTDPQVVLLQFGAQSLRAGTSGNQPGVLLSATQSRLTYPQVVAAVNGYVAGYGEARQGATNSVTVVVGTSSSGYKNLDGSPAAYTPAAKGADWANSVVEPAVASAAGSGIAVVAGNDIEANFDADFSEVTAWIGAYLAAGPNPLVNNGAASACPTTLGTRGATCAAVPVEKDDPSEPTVLHTWSQAGYYQISGGINPDRISVLPQIYYSDNATQWENISLTGTSAGKPALRFAGVLTSVAACDTANSGCSSIDPDEAWTATTLALEADATTTKTVVPAVTDLTIS